MPNATIFVNKKYKFIVCTIEKVACSSTRKWLLALEPAVSEHIHHEFQCDVHKNIYQCSSQNLLQLSQMFPGLNRYFNRIPYSRQVFFKLYFLPYFKIAFVRSPWSRLVSGYLSKFCTYSINQLAGAQVAAKYIYEKYNLDQRLMYNYNKPGGITFTQFVEYLSEIKDLSQLDNHWRPQHHFLADFRYNFVGKMEQQEANIEFLNNKLKLNAEYPHLTSHNYCSEKISCHDLMPYQLNRIRDESGGYPNWKNFYTQELKNLVGEIYKKDINQLKYTFND